MSLGHTSVSRECRSVPKRLCTWASPAPEPSGYAAWLPTVLIILLAQCTWVLASSLNLGQRNICLALSNTSWEEEPGISVPSSILSPQRFLSLPQRLPHPSYKNQLCQSMVVLFFLASALSAISPHLLIPCPGTKKGRSSASKSKVCIPFRGRGKQQEPSTG